MPKSRSRKGKNTVMARWQPKKRLWTSQIYLFLSTMSQVKIIISLTNILRLCLSKTKSWASRKLCCRAWRIFKRLGRRKQEIILILHRIRCLFSHLFKLAQKLTGLQQPVFASQSTTQSSSQLAAGSSRIQSSLDNNKNCWSGTSWVRLAESRTISFSWGGGRMIKECINELN